MKKLKIPKIGIILFSLSVLMGFSLEAIAADPTGNVDKGEKVYRTYCFSCHGVDPSHSGPLGPSIQGTSKQLLSVRLEQGLGNYPTGYRPKRQTMTMPPMPHVKPHLNDLLAYLNADHSIGTQRKTLPENVKRGKETYIGMCSGCHQADGMGKVGLAPSLIDQDFLSLASDKFMHDTIKKGRPGTNMIAFSFLTDDQVKDIISYFRSHQKRPSIAYDGNWKATGSHSDGEKLYRDYCSQCHGTSGKGYLLGGSGTGIGMQGFLSVASDGYIKQTLKYGREGTAMRSFEGSLGLAQLTDQDMNDIILYLRQLGQKNAQ